MSEQHIPEFEDRLRTLLARAAEAIPADTDLSAPVQYALTRDPRDTGNIRDARDMGDTRARTSVVPRPVLVTVAAVVVVALLAGVLSFVHPGGTSLRPAGGVTGGPTTTATAAPLPEILAPPCGPLGLGPSQTITAQPTVTETPGTPVDHAVSIGRHASVHGITITIDRAYADATQTVITYHMQTNVNPPLPASPVLIDAYGHRYGMISGDWDIQRGANYIFSPLPPEELGTPLTLTFYTQQMRRADPTGPGALVDGPWQISFNLTPAAGTSHVLSTQPLTHSGLTIQPLRLDVAPAGGGLDGARGGVRVVVRFSGLAPGMHLADFAMGIDTFLNLGGYESSCGGGVAVLILPDGQQMYPGVVLPLGQTVPITPAEQPAAQAQTVGPGGAVDLEMVFYTPIPAGTSVILGLEHVPAQLPGMSSVKQISGPWEFRLSPGA